MTIANLTVASVDSKRKYLCPICGEDGVVTKWNKIKFDYGSGTSFTELSATVPVHSCSPCDFQFLDEEAERLKHEAVCKHLGILPPRKIRGIRKKYKMSRATFSSLSGIGEASLHRWENGLTTQTHAYDRYLRLLTLPHVMHALEKLVDKNETRDKAQIDQRWRSLNESQIKENTQNIFQLRKAA